MALMQFFENMAVKYYIKTTNEKHIGGRWGDSILSSTLNAPPVQLLCPDTISDDDSVCPALVIRWHLKANCPLDGPCHVHIWQAGRSRQNWLHSCQLWTFSLLALGAGQFLSLVLVSVAGQGRFRARKIGPH